MAATNVIIPRDKVIPGYQLDDWPEGYAEVVNHEVTLTAAQVLALNTTPVDLLPAPSDGYKHVVLGVYASKPAGAFAGGAAVSVNYKDSSNTLVATIPAAHFTAAAADTRWATRPAQSGTPAAQAIPADGIDVSVATAFTGTGAAVTLTVRYVDVRA